jgi:protein-disulfide isomerase
MVKDKGFIIGIIATTILIVGGVFLMTKSNPQSPKKEVVSSDILIKKDSYITSGIENGNHLSASASASATLVEFGDYECPACSVYSPLIKKLLTDFSGKINFVFRNYPLSQHKNAQISSQVVEAAGIQGKYWQMHDKLFETQTDWVNSTDPISVFIGYAKELNLDIKKLEKDMSSDAIKNIIQNDTSDGNTVKLTETPTFYLNGVKIDGLTGGYEQFKEKINAVISNK